MAVLRTRKLSSAQLCSDEAYDLTEQGSVHFTGKSELQEIDLSSLFYLIQFRHCVHKRVVILVLCSFGLCVITVEKDGLLFNGIGNGEHDEGAEGRGQRARAEV